MTKAITRRCPYCQAEAEVTGMSAREIPGYVNPLNGKSTAMVERLSCSHEFVDGKFNMDSLYFSNHRPVQQQEIKIQVQHQYPVPVQIKRGGLQVMDVLCVVCAVFLLFTVPPLVIIPIVYFALRLR
jgi:hypothetical protein